MSAHALRAAGALAVTGLLGSAALAVVPASVNLPQALADTKAILNSGGQADIVVLGDSLSFRPGTYLPTFRNLLQTRYGNAGEGYQPMTVWTGAAFNNGWRREGINTDIAPHHGLDGLWTQFDGAAASPNQAYYYPYNQKVQLQYVAQPGGGTFRIRDGFDGTEIATINTAATSPEVRSYTYALPAGQNVFTVQPDQNGPVTILGQDNIRENAGVRVHRAANGGWGVDNFIQRDFSFDQQLDKLSTDLVMVWIGQNDQPYDRNTYAPKLNQLVSRIETAVPDAEIVLIGSYDAGTSRIRGLVDAMFDVASARNIGFINLYDTAGDYSFFQSHGYLDDGIHFSNAGGQYVGHLLFDAFMTDGASLVPEPTAIGAIGLLALAARRRA